MEEVSQLERQSYLYKLEALRSQIDRHFIFNAMTAIQHYILENERRLAVEYLDEFSELIRTILDQSRKTHVSLNEEMKLLVSYINLESMRFSNKFGYNFVIGDDVDTESPYIPSLLIQPYVENAIKHGLMHKESYGILEINIQKTQPDLLSVCIKDDGIGRENHKSINEWKKKNEALGQKITEERMEIYSKLFGSKFSVNITDLYDDNNSPAGTKVDILIPIM
ncbi:MAG: histidine kinase [Bacteroidia bacterium]|nr:histidine kinase [Bacteroidia bacterium]